MNYSLLIGACIGVAVTTVPFMHFILVKLKKLNDSYDAQCTEEDTEEYSLRASIAKLKVLNKTLHERETQLEQLITSLEDENRELSKRLDDSEIKLSDTRDELEYLQSEDAAIFREAAAWKQSYDTQAELLEILVESIALDS